MLKTNHLQMPKDEWRNLHNLSVSLDSAISSCSEDQFGWDVNMEIRGILERAEQRIQRVLDKNFAVKPKYFDKYHIITWHDDCGEDDKDDCRTLSEAKKLAKGYYKDGYSEVKIIYDHYCVWKIDWYHPKGYDPRK